MAVVDLFVFDGSGVDMFGPLRAWACGGEEDWDWVEGRGGKKFLIKETTFVVVLVIGVEVAMVDDVWGLQNVKRGYDSMGSWNSCRKEITFCKMATHVEDKRTVLHVPAVLRVVCLETSFVILPSWERGGSKWGGLDA
jgi:hypothetical protein